MNKLNLFDYMYIILYLCKESTNKTFLNKLLFFIDFAYASKNNYGQTITNDNYIILPFGPVPDSIEQVKQITISKGYLVKNEIEYPNYTEYMYNTNYNISLINIEKEIDKDKIEVIKVIYNKFKSKKAKYLAELSHRIDPWKSKANEWGKTIYPADMKGDEIYEKYEVKNLYRLIEGDHFIDIMKNY